MDLPEESVASLCSSTAVRCALARGGWAGAGRTCAYTSPSRPCCAHPPTSPPAPLARLARERPAWTPATHPLWPEGFRAAARLLLLAARAARPCQQQQQQEEETGGEKEEEGEQRQQQVDEQRQQDQERSPTAAAAPEALCGGWPLGADLTLEVLRRAAYPISPWCDCGRE